MEFISNAEIIRVLHTYKAVMKNGHTIVPDDIDISEYDCDILFSGTTRRMLAFITCGEVTAKEHDPSLLWVHDFLEAGHGEDEIRSIAESDDHPLHSVIDSLLCMFDERTYKVLYWMNLWAAVHPRDEVEAAKVKNEQNTKG